MEVSNTADYYNIKKCKQGFPAVFGRTNDPVARLEQLCNKFINNNEKELNIHTL